MLIIVCIQLEIILDNWELAVNQVEMEMILRINVRICQIQLDLWIIHIILLGLFVFFGNVWWDVPINFMFLKNFALVELNWITCRLWLALSCSVPCILPTHSPFYL